MHTMRKILRTANRLGIRLLAVFLFTIVLASAAPASAAPTEEPARAVASQASALCTPRQALRAPGRCSAHGPGGEAVRMARQGLYPGSPLPTIRFNWAFQYLPFDYLRVGDGGVPIYPSADSAAGAGGNSASVQDGFVYLSYYNEVETSGGLVFQTQLGYVRGDNVSRVIPPEFSGMLFYRTPSRPFGWIIEGGTCTVTAAGSEQRTGRCYTRYTPIQIYATERVGELDWYMIAPGEWVEQRLISMVEPDPTPPEGVEGDRWISVNLYEQTVVAYDRGELVFATAISSGRNGFWTQPGTFQVWAKLERDNMTGGAEGSYYYLEDVPWVLYFDQARALHGTYWHNRFGTPTSRGCVNLTPADASWFFNFADEGTWVHVYDPSGETPTDPSLYGAGGA